MQLLVITLVEIRIDLESVMLANYRWYERFKDHNLQTIVTHMNTLAKKYGNRLHVEDEKKMFTLDNLPDFSEVVPNRILNPDDFYETNDNNNEQHI